VVTVSGVPIGGGDPVENESEAIVGVKWFGVSKTSDKKVYRPGEEITYTIYVCHLRGATEPLRDVIVKDVFKHPEQVEILASYPEISDDYTWHISEIRPGECAKLILIARTPKVRTTFDLEQSVKGKGFVNVNNDLSTAAGPYGIENCVYVEATMGTVKVTNSTCAGVTIDDTGTELQTREHGSGDYDSEEITNLKWENRSIKSLKNVSASYAPTTFELPGNKAINYDSKWTEESRAKNHITGSVMHETYRYATDVNRDSYVKMDENGSRMVVDASFTGKGSIGFFKKATPDAKPKVKPIFESQEDYSGQFSINESFDEYGKNVVTTKAASGEGFVASDKRIQDSQRTYESGTGSYKSEEIVDTFTNYIAKDIEVAHKPSSYSYSPSITANQDMKWSEGIWSKSGKLRGGVIVAANDSTGAASVEVPCNTSNKSSAPATIISEKYSSLEYLKKDSVALGL
jgi:large repetitive protein